MLQEASFSHAVIIMLLVSAFFENQNLTTAGDLCPDKKELSPCTCSHVSLDSLLQSENQSTITTTTALPKLLVPRSVDKIIDKTPILESKELLNEAFSNRNSNSSYYTIVTCKLPKTLSAVEEVVSNGLHRKLVDKLIVTNLPAKKEHTLVHLPKGWLKNLRIKQFEIRDTFLAGDFIFNGNPFEGQEQSLTELTINNCYLSGGLSQETAGTVNTKGLNLLPRLENVDFSKNMLTHIYTSGFRYPPANLTRVNLSYNSIRLIEASAFSYILKLKHLDLSHNLLETITRSVFASPAKHLEHLNLSWNHLTVLPTDFFNAMPVLKSIDLKSNFLYTMPEKPWSVVWRQLKFIDVTGNFVDCNCNLLWLVKILTPLKANGPTSSPRTLPGQTVLGSCVYTKLEKYTEQHLLTTLTNSSLNCNL